MLYQIAESGLGSMLRDFKGCFSKPQWHNFQTYVGGLIYGGKNEKNIQDIASNAMDGRCQSSLNRFLQGKNWSINRVDNIRLNCYIGLRQGGVLSLDDTLIGKSGRNMEGAGKFFDHCSGTYLWGHNIVSTFYSNGQQKLPMHFALYFKKEYAELSEHHFKTKPQLSIELIKRALCIIHPNAIAFDLWYGSKMLFDFIDAMGLTWVTEAKTNRLVHFNGVWIPVKKMFKQIPMRDYHKLKTKLNDSRFKWYAELEVLMKNIGRVKIVILRKRKNSKNFTALISNNLDLDAIQIIKYYKCRWDIEVFYRDCKQHLGMGEYQVRKLDAVVRHLHLVFLAYTILKGRPCKSLYSKILAGISSIGSICERLKHWIFNQMLNGFQRECPAIPP